MLPFSLYCFAVHFELKIVVEQANHLIHMLIVILPLPDCTIQNSTCTTVARVHNLSNLANIIMYKSDHAHSRKCPSAGTLCQLHSLCILVVTMCRTFTIKSGIIELIQKGSLNRLGNRIKMIKQQKKKREQA